MTIIREASGYQLNHEPLMGMYNITEGDRVSSWFDVHSSDDLWELDDDDFIFQCENGNFQLD